MTSGSEEQEHLMENMPRSYVVEFQANLKDVIVCLFLGFTHLVVHTKWALGGYFALRS